MKIELKNVKHSKFASQETDCFEASIYIDGKKEGTVFNSGNGGCNSYHPWSLEEKLKEYAKTLPAMDVSYLYNDGEVHTMEHDADTLIGDLFTKHLQKKDCAKKVMFRIPNFEAKFIAFCMMINPCSRILGTAEPNGKRRCPLKQIE